MVSSESAAGFGGLRGLGRLSWLVANCSFARRAVLASAFMCVCALLRVWVGMVLVRDACEVRLCDPCDPCVPFVPCVSRLLPVSFLVQVSFYHAFYRF